MANKITQEDIYNINCKYLEIGTYAGVARALGFSAGTVKKYILPNFKPAEELKTIPFSSLILPIEKMEMVWSLQLSEEEQKEIEKLWEEISM